MSWVKALFQEDLVIQTWQWNQCRFIAINNNPKIINVICFSYITISITECLNVNSNSMFDIRSETNNRDRKNVEDVVDLTDGKKKAEFALKVNYVNPITTKLKFRNVIY